MPYHQAYFNRQRQIGEFGGQANLFKFAPFIKSSDTVLDFGCGGGWLLSRLNCRAKLGVDINPIARQMARQNGIKVYASFKSLPTHSLDKIISNHALEHVPHPLQTLIGLRRLLKPKGMIICVVPHEATGVVYTAADPNQHLYTWNEQTLGNLFHQGGYKVLRVEALAHQWPRYFRLLQSLVGWNLFHLICRLWALSTGNRQLLVVAQNQGV